MADGYVKLARCIMQKPIFHNEKLLKVWIWCLLKASHKEHEQLIGLQKIKLQPGQFVTGRYAGAKELKMNPSTFWKYLLWLSGNQSLDIQSNNKFSLVTLINWELYQIEPQKSNSKNDSKMTTKEQQRDTNKNVKNEKNELINISEEEKSILEYLPEINNYPLDAERDLRQVREWLKAYPADHVLNEIEKFNAWWRDKEATYKGKKNFRSSITNWLKKSKVEVKAKPKWLA